MNKYFTVIISSFIFLILGYFVGYERRINEEKNKSIELLKLELGEKEQQNILNFIVLDGKINKYDEGGLFSTVYAHYLMGTIKNNLVVTTIKDVKIRIDFLSKTKAIISSQEVTVYEFIKPGYSINLKEKVSWPIEAESFDLTLVESKVADTNFM